MRQLGAFPVFGLFLGFTVTRGLRVMAQACGKRPVGMLGMLIIPVSFVRSLAVACLLMGLFQEAIISGRPAHGQDLERATDFFEERIRPVLIDACYECHNSADTTEGGLAVDWKTPLMMGGDSGPVVVPGKPDSSRLLEVMRHEIPGLEMPEGRPRLSDQVLEDFRIWIEQGAHDPRIDPPTADETAQMQAWETLFQRRSGWWSFQPIQSVTPPSEPPFQEWSSGPIDAFVAAKLGDHKLFPQPMASANTLIRRLYFTLIGLPPSAEELEFWEDEFRGQSSSQHDRVVQRLVDCLLANPHFGERWARHWMDWIRYAESHGSEGDPSIPDAWRYRDYLIRSFNADVPLDQMIREYIAGDLLENPRVDELLQTNESVIGPVPWRMVFHGFAPTDALDERVRFLDDHINTMTKAFLGLTVSCARCHDHKFDPISQRDYYALYGIAASSRPARQVIDSPTLQAKSLAELNDLKAEIKSQLITRWLDAVEELPELLRARLQDNADAPSPGTLLGSLKEALGSAAVTAHWSNLTNQVTWGPQESTIFQADLSDPESYAEWFPVGLGLADKPSTAGEFALQESGAGIIESIYPSGAISNTVSRKHAARLTSPVLKIDQESELWVFAAGGGEATFRYVVQDYPRSGTVYPFPKLTPQWRWIRLDLGYWKGDEIHIEFAHALDAPLPQSGNTHSWFAVKHAILLPKGSQTPQPPISWASAITELQGDSAPESVDQLIASYVSAIRISIENWQNNALTDNQAWLLNQCLQEEILGNEPSNDTEIMALVEKYRQIEARLPVPRRVPGVDDIDAGDRPLFVRGNHKQPAEIVPRSFLTVFDSSPFRGPGSGRIELARKILEQSNPLTPRVMANRVWYHLFGRGIVDTPDNLGLLGKPPSHPALLDWLANDLLRDGWSLKKLIRKIVTSKTWLQDSGPSQESKNNDPGNEFVSHHNLRRLEAEPIRDLILAASGMLDRTLFGPPVSGNSSRRSVYIAVRRNSLDPLLTAFNLPEPFACAGRRNATNVPAQSLMMMNDPMIRTQAEAWVDALLGDSPDATLTHHASQMFYQLTGRVPGPGEVAQIEKFFEELGVAHRRLLEQKNRLHQEREEIKQGIAAIIDPAREKLLAQLEASPLAETVHGAPPIPAIAWDFAEISKDDHEVVKLQGTAELTPRGLVTGRQGFASVPLALDVRAKSLEAWVMLENLSQRGGGVLSIQTADGTLFDSIVFGELEPTHWLAGSEFHKRTKPFRGPAETDAIGTAVHFAITYADNGLVTAFRNGVPYGQPYSAEPPRLYQAGQATLTFGLRHLPAGGNRYLDGTIVASRLYDRALNADEVMASYLHGPRVIDDSAILATLEPEARLQLRAFRNRLGQVSQEIDASGQVPRLDNPRARLIELARALYTLQEAIFLR